MDRRQEQTQHAGPQQRAAASGSRQTMALPKAAKAKACYLGFAGSIDSQAVSRIAAALNNAANDGCEEAHLCFSSPGGYVADGIYLYNHIRALPMKVVAHNVGSVSSIAVSIFLAADERTCSSHAMFMMHATVMPSEAMGADRLRSALEAALADDRRTEDILRKRARIPEAVLAERRTRDVHITPSQAVEYGISHAVREFLLPRGSVILQL